MRYAMLCLILVLASCEMPVEPLPRPPGAVEVEPLPRWVDWYAEIEECAGVEGDVSAVRWHEVPGGPDWDSTYNGKDVAGEWWPPHDLYIAEGRIGHETERTVVAHEIGHDLIQDHDPHHEHSIWGTCAPRSL